MKWKILFGLFLLGLFLAYEYSPVQWTFNDTITFDERIYDAALYPHNDMLYVIHGDGNPLIDRRILTILDGLTLDIREQISLPEDLIPYEIQSGENRIIMFSSESENLFFYDFSSNDLIETDFSTNNLRIWVDDKYHRLFLIYFNQGERLTTIKIIEGLDYVTEEKLITTGNPQYIFNSIYNTFFIYDFGTKILHEYDLKNLEEINSLNMTEFGIDSVTHAMKMSDAKHYMLMSGGQINLINSDTLEIANTFHVTSYRDRTFYHLDKLYSVTSVEREPFNSIGYLQVWDPFSGEMLNEIEVGSAPNQIMADPHLNQIYVVNSGTNSISILDQNLNLIVNNTRNSVDVSLAVFFVLIFVLVLATNILKSKRMFFGILGLILSVFGLWMFWLTLQKTNTWLLLPSVILLTYVVTYFILLVARHSRIRDLIYYDMKERLIKTYYSNSKWSKNFAGIVILSWVISIPVIYLVLYSPISLVFDTLPLDFLNASREIVPENSSIDNLWELFVNLFSGIGVGYAYWLLLSIGPVWILLLRLIRTDEESKNDIKNKGSRALLLFLYLGYFIFAIQELAGLDIFFDSRFRLPDLFSIFGTVLIYVTTISSFIYLLEKKLFEKQSEKNIEDEKM